MEFPELSEKINQEMDSGDFSLQAVFNRNIEAIERLKQEGYSYKRIFYKLDTGLHEGHFRDLIRRAKIQVFITPEKTNQSITPSKSKTNKTSQEEVQHRSSQDIPDSLLAQNNQSTAQELNIKNKPFLPDEINAQNHNLEEWTDILGFEITERTFNKITALKLTKNEILGLEILNQRRLINFLNELAHKTKNK